MLIVFPLVHFIQPPKQLGRRVLLTSVVSQQNYLTVKCPHFTIYVLLLKFILLMGTNLQESADRFKSTNKILNIKEKITLCKMPVL